MVTLKVGSTKLSLFLKGLRWEWLTAWRLNNLKINQILRPANDLEIAEIPIETSTLELTQHEYMCLVNCTILRRYSRLSYAHSKPLEYLTTIKLLGLTDSDCILDAAGGQKAEYTRAVIEFTKFKLTAYCQDSLLNGQNLDGISYIGGSIEAIPLPDESVDAISCHHSFEHFRHDLDVKFIQEAVRLLRVDGRLVITPLFITNEYAEIWNNKHVETYDPENATTIIDSTATFAGWGPYEGFARVYCPVAFKQRILDNLPSNCKAKLFKVLLNGRPVPDIRKNSHQPLLNTQMKALLIHKTKV